MEINFKTRYIWEAMGEQIKDYVLKHANKNVSDLNEHIYDLLINDLNEESDFYCVHETAITEMFYHVNFDTLYDQAREEIDSGL